MNSIEEYQNLVELLKQALNFYANKSNYQVPNKSDGDYNLMTECVSPEFRLTRVEIDGGFQAQFALDKVKELEALNEKLQNDYDKLSNKILDDMENGSDGETNPIDLINVFIQSRDDNNL